MLSIYTWTGFLTTYSVARDATNMYLLIFFSSLFCFYFAANVIVLILSPKKNLLFFLFIGNFVQFAFHCFGLLTHLFHHFSAYFLCFMLSAMCKVIRIFFQVLNGVINVSSQFASSVAVGETTQCTADQRT